MKIKYTTQFKKDYKRLKKQHKNLEKLKVVIELLSTSIPLDPIYHDHPLSGNWKYHRDCHIEPDWILIYRISESELVLELSGSHSELFKK